MKFEMMQMRTGPVQTTLTCGLFAYLFVYLSGRPTKILHCEHLWITSVSRVSFIKSVKTRTVFMFVLQKCPPLPFACFLISRWWASTLSLIDFAVINRSLCRWTEKLFSSSSFQGWVSSTPTRTLVIPPPSVSWLYSGSHFTHCFTLFLHSA